MEYRIIPFEEWGGKYGRGWGKRALPVQFNILHHPAMKGDPGVNATFEQDAEYVRRVEQVGYDRFSYADDGWERPAGAGLSYTWLVMKSGRIFEGHDVERQSSHTSGYNYSGVGIAWAGNFEDGEEPTLEQVNATIWLLQEAVRRGWTVEPKLHYGHRDVYPTECPADAYPYIALVNELIAEGGTMAKRRPTRADIKAKTDELIERGFTITCGPYHYADGRCAPGKHPHASDSRHFKGMAIDVSFDPRRDVPVSDYERAHLDLLVKEMNMDPVIDWRYLWRENSGAHHDHAHFDDSTWYRVANYANIPDGGAVLISPKAFPNYRPKGNDGFTLSVIVKVQGQLRTLGFYTGALDGYLGPQTRGAVKAFQTASLLTADGLPGARTQTALDARVALEALNAGFTTEQIKAAQRLLKELGYYDMDIDGLRGPGTEAAIRNFQRDAGLTVDGLPGAATMKALTDAVAEKNAPKPEPEPEPAPAEPTPTPAPEVIVSDVEFTRLTGSNRYAVAVAVSRACWPYGANSVYLSATETDDVAVAASGHREGPVLVVPADRPLPRVVRDEIVRLDPKRVVLVGGGAERLAALEAEVAALLS